MTSKVKTVIDAQGKNPHQVSFDADLTYRIVLNLYNAEKIKPTTPIGTLAKLAKALNVGIDDLYDFHPTENGNAERVAA